MRLNKLITSDNFLLWLLRCLSLPLSAICFYISFGIYHRLFNGTASSLDTLPAVFFPASGGLLLLYFIILWTVKPKDNH